MIGITRRQAIGTMGAAAAYAAGFGMPSLAETPSGTAGIDRTLRDAVAARRAAGVVALAATAAGPLYSGAFGARNVTQPQDMTLDSVFWIASMTKAVTTTAAMQLVEQGKLQLDQPAGDMLPSRDRRRCWKGSTPRVRRSSARPSGRSPCGSC